MNKYTITEQASESCKQVEIATFHDPTNALRHILALLESGNYPKGATLRLIVCDDQSLQKGSTQLFQGNSRQIIFERPLTVFSGRVSVFASKSLNISLI